MVYIETRTSVQEVLDDIERELRAMCNSTIYLGTARRQTPSQVTKTSLRERHTELQGALQIASRLVGGSDRFSAETTDAIDRAHQAVREGLAA